MKAEQGYQFLLSFIVGLVQVQIVVAILEDDRLSFRLSLADAKRLSLEITISSAILHTPSKSRDPVNSLVVDSAIHCTYLRADTRRESIRHASQSRNTDSKRRFDGSESRHFLDHCLDAFKVSI